MSKTLSDIPFITLPLFCETIISSIYVIISSYIVISPFLFVMFILPLSFVMYELKLIPPLESMLIAPALLERFIGLC